MINMLYLSPVAAESHLALQVATVLRSAGPAWEARPSCCGGVEASCSREHAYSVHTAHMLVL